MAQYLKDCGSVCEGLRSKTEVLMCFRNFVVDPEAGKKKKKIKQNKTRQYIALAITSAETSISVVEYNWYTGFIASHFLQQNSLKFRLNHFPLEQYGTSFWDNIVSFGTVKCFS